MKTKMIVKILGLVLIFILYPLMSFATISSQETYRSTSGSYKVAIIVNDSIYDQIFDPSLKQYIADLEAEDYTPIVTRFASGTQQELRAYFQSIQDLKGAVLVGDLPLPYDHEYILDENKNVKNVCLAGGYCQDPAKDVFLSDYYYMDLTDTYDDWLTAKNPPSLKPEIWVSRLPASTLTGYYPYKGLGESEVYLLNRYFKKNHDYRTGFLSIPHRGLDYNFSDVPSDYSKDLALIYGTNLRSVYGPSATVDDYVARLQGLVEGDYEWVDPFQHGVPDGLEGSNNQNLYSNQVATMDLHPLFYTMNHCSVGKFTSNYYFAGTFLFSPKSNALAVFAATSVTSGYPLGNIAPLVALQVGNNLGEGLKADLEKEITLVNHDMFKAYWSQLSNHSLFGDGTLRFDPPIPRIASITPQQVSYEEQVNFSGEGSCSMHNIVGYSWRSSRDGVLSNQASFFSKTLSPGIHTIYFKVLDSLGRWSSEVCAQLAVEGTCVNAPLAWSQTLTNQIGKPISIILNAKDINNRPLTYKIKSGPKNGGLSVPVNSAFSSNQLTYAPSSSYAGIDSFTFIANNGQSDSRDATVTIYNIYGLNHAPTLAIQDVLDTRDIVVVSQGRSKQLYLFSADLDEDNLTFIIKKPPQYGTISISDFSFPVDNPKYVKLMTYTPDTSYTGYDSISLVANDKQVDSNAACVTFYVSPVKDGNTAPYAFDYGKNNELQLYKDSVTRFPLMGFDVDTWYINLSMEIVTQPAHGFAYCTGTIYHSPGGTYAVMTDCVYRPNHGYVGSDSLQFVVRDGNKLTSNLGTITFSVIENTVPNTYQYPVAIGQSLSTMKNVPLSITLTGNDPNPNCQGSLSMYIISPPSHGTIPDTAIYSNIMGKTLVYTPNKDFVGHDSFKFFVCSCGGTSDIATIDIDVIDPTLALRMPMNGDIKDYSGNKIPTSWNGTEAYGQGILGKSISLNGSSSVVISHNDLLDGQGATSLSLWVKKAQTSANPDSTILWKDGVYEIKLLGSQGVQARLTNSQSQTVTLSASSTISNNNTSWHHYCVTYDGANAKLYFDGGLPKDTKPLTGILAHAPSSNLILGKGASSSFTGSLDTVWVYTRVLTDAEVKYLYNGTQFGDVTLYGGVSATDAAMVARYASGLQSLSSQQMTQADVTGDGKVSAYDAGLIAQYSAGLIQKLPADARFE